MSNNLGYPALGAHPSTGGTMGGAAFFSPSVDFWDYSCGFYKTSLKEFAPGLFAVKEGDKFHPIVKAWKVPFSRMKKMLSDSILNRSKDGRIIQYWKDQIDLAGVVPVRSGHLFSTIFSTMRISRSQKYQNRYWMLSTFEFPEDYPETIDNPQHSPPSQGSGKHPSTVNKRMMPSNVSLIRTTPKTGIYMLNDPHAMQISQDVINQITSQSMYNIMYNLFISVLIKVYI